MTRFANNTIHQNVAEQTLSISVRAVIDGRTARAGTNRTDDESLRRAVAAAISLARNKPRNPDLLPMLRPQKCSKVARFFGATAETMPQDRARAVKRVCQTAKKYKQTAAGIFSSGAMQSVLANSKGLYARITNKHAPSFCHYSRAEFFGSAESMHRTFGRSIRMS